ncbi:MAG: GDP-mannose 4,6-dehydratase, partial [Bacteroidales bacterium]|nr:GDP-mannose 4,6-dehydratase [Bacteroidales bacterium]
LGPRACYDEGKRCAETLFMNYHTQNKVRIKIARIFNTYGPRMHPNDGRVVSNFIVQALKGDDLTIFGDGSHTRSFQYIDDLIDGLIKLMDTSENFTGPVNLGNPVEVSVGELAQKIIKMTGSKSKVVYMPLPEDDPRQRKPDISLAIRELGWKPEVDLESGLSKTIEYFKKYLNVGGYFN